MVCSNCGTQNPSDAKFCAECGTRLTLTCANGHPVSAGSKFCNECGAPIAASPAGVPAPAAEGSAAAGSGTTLSPLRSAERRLVSVLFADLVGFTTLSERRDAEEVRELLTRYFDAARRFVELYGGTVEKFIGDAVMAVWGTPVAQEDDAERAVRAALDLVQAVTDLGEEVGAPELRARAGVLTGEAAVTLGAEGQGMVAGDLVNTASRIQSAASPGSVFVGEATKRATEAAIVYEDAGFHELKGKAEPLRLARAVRIVAGARGGLRSTGLEAPFVGRDRELKTVKELFFSVVESGRAHLISIIGIAGHGKSRLSWEFYKYFDGLPQLTWYHRGRCLSYGEGVTYWALAEMVRMRARIAEGEDQASATAKLHATVEEHVKDPEERKWIEPRLAHLIGLEERTARDREDLFAAWRLFFERLAEKNTTVMVFEDMHWADTALLDFIDYLMEWSKNHRLYVVVLARPELLERRPTWGQAKRNFSTVYLEPLPARMMDELLAGLVPGLPDEVRAKILERAEGVPLYAMETVRMLMDRGLLVQEGSTYRPAGPIESLDVPETLQALIAARLDGLTPDERRLVQDASVLGKTFFREAVAAIGGNEPDEVEPILSSLVRKEVLSIQADIRSPERGQYGFLQDLVRKIAYETLPKKDRKAKHLAVARYLEATWGEHDEEIAEVLASHYVDAYREVPDADDAAQIRAKARRTLTRAGEWASSLAASEEAVRYFEQAIELTDEPLEQAELHERAGLMAWNSGLAHDAVRHYERAIELFDSLGLQHPAARVSAAYADIQWQQGRPEEAVERLQRAYDVLAHEEPDPDLAVLEHQLGRFLYFTGRVEEAAPRIEDALRIAELLRVPEVFAQALNTKSLFLKGQGRVEEGRILLEHSLQVALDNDLAAAALRAYNNLVALFAEEDRHVEELEMSERGLELARRVGIRNWELKLLANQMNPLFFLGRWDEALARGEETRRAGEMAELHAVAVEFAPLIFIETARGELAAARDALSMMAQGERSADLALRSTYTSSLAHVLRAEGKSAEALQAAEEALGALAPTRSLRDPQARDSLVEAIEAAFALGDLSKAEELVGVISGVRPGELTPYIRAQGSRLLARLATVRGDAPRADEGFTSAASMFREYQMPFYLAVTLLEQEETRIAAGRGAGAEELLREAREIFERLGARPWLDRVDASAAPRAPEQAAAPAAST